MQNRSVVSTQNAPSAIGPYSQAIKIGNFVFISGQLPIDMITCELSTGSIAEQTRCSLQNAAAIAAQSGTSLDKAVKTTVFLTNIADFSEVNTAYAEFFPSNPPARSCIAVAGLPKGARVEIEVICTL